MHRPARTLGVSWLHVHSLQRRFAAVVQWLGLHLAVFWSYLRGIRIPARRQAAQGLVEYALILVLIAIVVVGILTQVGKTTSTTFVEIECSLDGGEMHTDNGQNNSAKCKKK